MKEFRPAVIENMSLKLGRYQHQGHVSEFAVSHDLDARKELNDITF